MIVPRKGVIELMRMLDGGDNPLRVQISSNNIRAPTLATSSPPNWWMVASRIIAAFCPKPDKRIWKLAAICSSRHFARAAILSNEIPRRRLYVQRKPAENLPPTTRNRKKRKDLDVTYSGAEMEMASTSVNMLDVLNADMRKRPRS